MVDRVSGRCRTQKRWNLSELSFWRRSTDKRRSEENSPQKIKGHAALETRQDHAHRGMRDIAEPIKFVAYPCPRDSLPYFHHVLHDNDAKVRLGAQIFQSETNLHRDKTCLWRAALF